MALNHVHIPKNGTAATDPPPTPQKHVSPAPGPSVTASSDSHSRASKRVFIGPYPVSIAAPQIKRTHKVIQKISRSFSETSGETARTGDEIEDESLWRFIRQSAHRPGASEWDTELGPGVREELIDRLKSSAWLPNPKQKQHTKWVGDTFQVGTDLLGKSIIVEDTYSKASSSRAPSSGNGPTSTRATVPATPSPQPAPPSETVSTYVTAASSSSQLHRVNDSPAEMSNPGSNPHDYLSAQPNNNRISTSTGTSSRPAKSDTFLLEEPVPEAGPSVPKAASAIPANGDAQTVPKTRAAGLRSALRRNRAPASERPRGPRLSVNFAEETVPEQEQEETPAAPPRQVLSRHFSKGQLGNTSAGAAISTRRSLAAEGVQMIDRMLVQVSYSRAGGLSSHYDEEEARKHPELEEKEWGEYVVSWTSHTLELYEDHGSFVSSWIAQHKHLAYAIPLEQNVTRISMYSHTDMTFCVTSPPIELGGPSRRPRLRKSEAGTSIFIFKCKARSRAIDWIWKLKHTLGSRLPPSIDVHVPALGTRVTFEIPVDFEALTVERITESCREVLAAVPEYREISTEVERGATMALAWSREMKLDWVWLDDDIESNPRDWAVLFGLALQGRIPMQLELRVATHAITRARLADGSELEEPEGIEGYLYRLKLKTQARANVYISSHDGYLFTIQTAHANPPPIPQANSLGESTDASSAPASYTREDEIRRAASQILKSSGYMDLRDIVEVRRPSKHKGATASGHSPHHSLGSTEDPNSHEHERDDDRPSPDPSHEVDSDSEEPGGEAHLAAHPNTPRLKLKRTFELVLRSGMVLRFEAHSVSNAIEWVRRLNALIRYWTRRHRMDARVEMDIVHYSSGKQRFEAPRSRAGHPRNAPVPSALPDPQAASASMSSFWSWCVLEGCRPIIKSGRLFAKTAPRKFYKHTFMVLIPGHIVLYHITNTPYGLQHASQTLNLTAAFVYTGVLAAAHLPTLFDPNPAPRRYQDGLETDDPDLATTFVIQYRKQPLGWKDDTTEGPPIAPLTSAKTPQTHKKHKLLILKARSQLERDSWCWALNAELERTVRAAAGREQRLRGGIRK